MRPLPFSEFRSDYGIAWPRWMRFEPDIRRTNPLFVLLALIFTCLVLLFSAVAAEAATFSGAGQTCPMVDAYELRSGLPFTLKACGTVMTCEAQRVAYLPPDGHLSVPGACSQDRVFASPFDGVTP